LLAQGGLENLSTRKLADHFGIKSASLYYHFRNKQQLLDHVADVMVSPAWREAQGGETWQAWLTRLAHALRGCMLSYPDGALLYAGASPPSDLLDERLDLLFRPTMAAGLSKPNTRYALLTVIRFTIGWAIDEQTAHARGADRPPEKSTQDFDVGLHILVSGIEVLFAEQAIETPLS